MEATLKSIGNKVMTEEIKVELPYYYKENKILGGMFRIAERDGKLVETQLITSATGFRMYSESEFTSLREGRVDISENEFTDALDVIINSLEEVANDICG
jgi:hypothetical protein